ncbi:MAG: bifunctional molybdenum cofactor biosynthesis protein MoaC/MoaB [Bdellovibrionales bacterium]|nr:bifunctional molybdenum cofactor biosynthesis protein MoaC/MoaB [Bdellovibrionales bacterium]
MESRNTSLPSAASFRMIDVGAKPDTSRRAVASGSFFAAPATLSRIRERTLPKGDVLALAEIAGIQGAKKTADLLPLCHPLPLTSVRVWTDASGDQAIRVFCEARTVGKTGVEMEALGGVMTALLCLYDLTKGVDPVLGLGEVKLELKEGGKTGHWVHPGSGSVPAPAPLPVLDGVSASLLTLSDRCSRGEAEDRSGPAIRAWITNRGGTIASERVVPDDRQALANELESMLREGRVQLIVTTGGTGLAPRDVTPETVAAFCAAHGGREVPGIGERLRAEGARHTPMSWLSRSAGFQVGGALVLCLPGSPKAVVEGLNAVEPLLKHAIHVSKGGSHP